MLWVFASTAVGLYCSGTRVVTMFPVSFTMSSIGLETVWYPISSLCASLNAKTLAGVTLYIFFASEVLDAQMDDRSATKNVPNISLSL